MKVGSICVGLVVTRPAVGKIVGRPGPAVEVQEVALLRLDVRDMRISRKSISPRQWVALPIGRVRVVYQVEGPEW